MTYCPVFNDTEKKLQLVMSEKLFIDKNEAIIKVSLTLLDLTQDTIEVQEDIYSASTGLVDTLLYIHNMIYNFSLITSCNFFSVSLIITIAFII